MINKSILRLVATLGFFAFMATVSAMSRPVSAQSCDAVTDPQIVAEIYAKIRADKALAPQIPHINVASVFAAVRLQGWADSRKDYDKVVAIVSATRCVRLVNVNLFEPQPPPPDSPLRVREGGCAAGTKRCGDVCIPEGDNCGITIEAGN